VDLGASLAILPLRTTDAGPDKQREN